MKDIYRTLAEKNGTLEAEYAALVNRKIRARYSLSEELALHRKREKDPVAFAAFDAYAERCKEEARLALGLDRTGRGDGI